MVVFSLIKGLVSREPIVKGCMVYSQPNAFLCVVFVALWNQDNLVISSLDLTRHCEL